MKYALIDNDALKVLKLIPTIRQGEYWADILAPDNDFKVIGLTKRELCSYSDREIANIHNNTFNETITHLSYTAKLTALDKALQGTPVDNTPLPDLEKKLGRSLPSEPAVIPQDKPKIKPQDKPKSKKEAAPRAGTTSAKVWEVATQLFELNGRQQYPSVLEVQKLCYGYGINKATAATQYSRWKRRLKNS